MKLNWTEKNLSFAIGLGLIALGLIYNKYALGQLMFPQYGEPLQFHVLVVLVEVVLIAIGLIIAIKRPSLHGSGIIGLCLIALGLILNKYILEQIVFPQNVESLRFNVLVILVQLTLIGTGLVLAIRRPSLRISGVNLMLAFAGVLVALIMAEVSTRVWLGNFASAEDLARWGTLEQNADDRRLILSSHHYLPFVPTPNYESADGNKHNSLGFRGDEVEIPKPQGTFRIALLGGSTTYTFSVPHYKQSYPYLLETILHERGFTSVEVINAGVPAYSSFESLINLEFRVLDVEPDLIIVYHGTNDVPDRMVFPFEAYRGDNSGSRATVTQTSDTIWDHSAVLRIAREVLYFTTPERVVRTYQDISTNLWKDFSTRIKRGDYPNGPWSHVSATEILKQNKPVYFERNIRNMVGIAAAHNVQAVLMTFAFSPLPGTAPIAATKEYASAISEHNDVLRGICSTLKASCYDFEIDMPVELTFWYDGVHVNEAGSLRKAQLVSDYLIESGLIFDSQASR